MNKDCLNIINTISLEMAKRAIQDVKLGIKEKMNAVWLEASGCFGEVISLLNGEEPDVIYMLQELLNVKYFSSIMGEQGEQAYEDLLKVIDTDYIFIVCGAAATKDNGLYNTIATYKGERITAISAIDKLAKNAKYIVAVGTCAAYGGPTAAAPNESLGLSIGDYLKRKDIINIPGCPANPVWTLGILGYLVSVGVPRLDSFGRPAPYYSETIHERCPRRRFFDKGVYAKKFGDEECMFLLGCRGPETFAYCPVSRWNNTENWPIEDNTTCIGCASPGFPDKMEPFVQYGGGFR